MMKRLRSSREREGESLRHQKNNPVCVKKYKTQPTDKWSKLHTPKKVIPAPLLKVLMSRRCSRTRITVVIRCLSMFVNHFSTSSLWTFT